MSNNGMPPKLEACSKFYRAIEEQGVNIKQRGSTGDGGIFLEYNAEGPDESRVASEIVEIAGAFCGADKRGVLGDLEATVYEPVNEKVGTWRVKAEWVERFHAGEWGEEEMMDAVDETLEVE